MIINRISAAGVFLKTSIMKVFEIQQPLKPNVFQKIFGITPRINGAIAIQNLFASFLMQTEVKLIEKEQIERLLLNIT